MTDIIVPPGYRLFFIFIALTKLALLSPGIKPAEKLQFLEMLDGLPDTFLTREMIEMIEPMCDKGYAIYAEAKSIDPPGDKTAKGSFAVLTSERVFGHFLALNPSIGKAIEWRESNRGRTVATGSTSGTVSLPSAPPPTQAAALSSYGAEIPDRFVQPR